MDTTKPNTKSVWPFWAILGVSILTSSGAAFLITWQSLKRIGEEKAAKKFFLIGGFSVILIQLIVVLLLSSTSLEPAGNILWLVGTGFPWWFKVKYLDKWQSQSDNKTSFSLDIMGWMVLGILLTIVISVLFSLVIDPSVYHT